jgi:hypothetical protein
LLKGAQEDSLMNLLKREKILTLKDRIPAESLGVRFVTGDQTHRRGWKVQSMKIPGKPEISMQNS